MSRPQVRAAVLISALALGGAAQNPPKAAARTSTFQDRRLDESSGVVAGRRYPGLLWTMNDSGGDPVFLRGADGHLRLDPDRPTCDIAGREPQGEGIDFWNQDTLVLTSERATFPAGIISLLRCPGK